MNDKLFELHDKLSEECGAILETENSMYKLGQVDGMLKAMFLVSKLINENK